MASFIPGFNNNLFNNITFNQIGVGQAVQDKAPKNIIITGTDFGGGAVTIEFSVDNVNYYQLMVGSDAVSAGQPYIFQFLAGLYGAYYRARLDGASGGTVNVSAALV